MRPNIPLAEHNYRRQYLGLGYRPRVGCTNPRLPPGGRRHPSPPPTQNNENRYLRDARRATFSRPWPSRAALNLAPYWEPPAQQQSRGPSEQGCGPGKAPGPRCVLTQRGAAWRGGRRGDAHLPPCGARRRRRLRALGPPPPPLSPKHQPATRGEARRAGCAGTHLLGNGRVRARRGRGAGAGLGLHVPVEQSLALLRAAAAAAAAAQRRHLITESRGPSDRCGAGRGKGGGGRAEAGAEGQLGPGGAGGGRAPGPPQEPARGPERRRAWGDWGKDATAGWGRGGGDDKKSPRQRRTRVSWSWRHPWCVT